MADLRDHQQVQVARATATASQQQQQDSCRRMSFSAKATPSEDQHQQHFHVYEDQQQDEVNDEDMDDSAEINTDHLQGQENQPPISVNLPQHAVSQCVSVSAASAAPAPSSVDCSSSASNAAQSQAERIQHIESVIGVDLELQQEILRDMLRKERKYRIYNGEAKYLKHRRVVVDWICEVGEEHKLSSLTIHCAVRYLDRLLGTADVPKGQLQLVAMTCILIGAKYEEAEDVIPTLVELNGCSDNAYTVEMIKQMEVCILRHLDWCLTVVNPIHFLQYFQASGIVFNSDLFEGGQQNRRSAIKYAQKYLEFFAELCLQEYTFQQYLPSVMAAAVVAAACRAVKIDPIWNAELEALTGYNERQIYKAYKHLYQFYINSFPAAPDNCKPSPSSVTLFEQRAIEQQQQQTQSMFHRQQQQLLPIAGY